MVKSVFSKRTIERAVRGKSTLVTEDSGTSVITPLDTHVSTFYASENIGRELQQMLLDQRYVWSLQKQLHDLRTENNRYREAVDFLLRDIWAALDPMESLVSLLAEELHPVRNTMFFVIFNTGEVTNIWIQLSNRDLNTEMKVAAIQSKVLRVFSPRKIRFLVVPSSVANLRKLAPETARLVKIKRN